MFSTRRLLQHASRITLFTRNGCSLCDNAKATLMKLQQRRPFAFTEIEVMSEAQKQWKLLYEFDTPVIHVDRPSESLDATPSTNKLMHRFTEEEVEGIVDRVENGTSP